MNLNIKQSSMFKMFAAQIETILEKSDLFKSLLAVFFIVTTTSVAFGVIALIGLPLMLFARTYGVPMGDHVQFVLYIIIPLAIGIMVFYLMKEYFVLYVDHIRIAFDGMMFFAFFLISVDHIYPDTFEQLRFLYGNDKIWGATLNILLFRTLLGYYVLKEKNQRICKKTL